MNEQILSEFISIGTETQQDAELIFLMTSKYLDDLKKENYNPIFATLLEGFINKMIVIGDNLGFGENLNAQMEADIVNFLSVISANPITEVNAITYYNKLYSSTMKFYNYASKLKPKETVDIGPFKPNNSDKSKITLTISEAIELINNSKILTDKIKKNLIEKLTDVISELNNPKTNWNVYYRQIGNVINLLGAIGTIAGASVEVYNITQSKEKLEEANKILQVTSITLSDKDLKEVFIVNENPKLNISKILQIEEKKIGKK